MVQRRWAYGAVGSSGVGAKMVILQLSMENDMVIVVEKLLMP